MGEGQCTKVGEGCCILPPPKSLIRFQMADGPHPLFQDKDKEGSACGVLVTLSYLLGLADSLSLPKNIGLTVSNMSPVRGNGSAGKGSWCQG